ncbi:MAG: nitroreductase [Deltaproteobacteria bacterium]|nr:MAG: nitroreductase [Deltaproteobacteria bacterium]
MNIKDALKRRKAVRAFLDKAVENEKIRRILEAAKHAPSGTNTQPWQVAVVTGDTKIRLGELLENAFRSGVKGKMDYQYYPGRWKEPYRGRRRACGLQLYTALEITREDRERQLEQWAANYRAFDAPAVLFFFMDPDMEKGSFMDYGMFLQSVMLAAVEEGLATCPQASLGEYPDIVREFLGYPDDTILVCGMAMGYEDTRAKVNSYRTPREKVHEFTRFFG